MTGATLAIGDLAARTGIAPGTLRMWETRYGFPVPERTASGYRRYSEADVEVLTRTVSFRERGLSVPAALERARQSSSGVVVDRPSLYGAVVASGQMPVRGQQLSKRTLLALSRAIEDEALARASAPVVIGAFQSARNYRGVQSRYRRLAQVADCCVVFADFDALREEPGLPVEVPVAADEALGNEWAVVVDAPGYAAALLAWEVLDSPGPGSGVPDTERHFESAWTTDPRTVRVAAQAAAHITAQSAPHVADRLDALLADRPLSNEAPAPGLTALTNRILGYLEAA